MTPVTDIQVSYGLNLQLTLKDSHEMPALMLAIASKRDSTFASLQALNFVHFARFLPTRDNSTLQVITSFDGPIEAYALDFVIAIGETFDAILSFVRDAPPLPVRQHPAEFLAFVRQNNRVVVKPPELSWDDYPTYSAYPHQTVIDIVGPRSAPPPMREVAPSAVDRSDVQGNILAGYRTSYARHYALRITVGPKACALLKRLVEGDGVLLPTITTAEIWQEKPRVMLNIGLTVQGLQALGVPSEMLVNFSAAFRQGPGHIDRATANGDTGDCSPEFWDYGNEKNPVHMLISLYAGSPEHQAIFEQRHMQLKAAFIEHGLTLVHQQDAQALPNERVHFGYQDGIAQPRLAMIEGSTTSTSNENPDGQPPASVGEFLLGNQYTSVYGGNSLGSLPATLCQNGTFAAVRVMDQDVAAFEAMLDKTSKTHGVDREWIAAKLMGRWRDGRPLSATPLTAPDTPSQRPSHTLNNNSFDYAPSHIQPTLPNDHQGLICPVGAHIRRMNPRSALVAGQPYSRRLIRRGMPYGPEWTPDTANARRGLFGFFMCADLERQFEFILQHWANGDVAANGIRQTQDPIIGAQTLSGKHVIQREAHLPPIEIETPRWTTTRASLYIFIPGIQALRWLAQGEHLDTTAAQKIGPAQWLAEAPAVRTHSRLAPSRFDPMDPDFLRNPYPYYALYRQHAPVAQVQRGPYTSYWIFSHELCQQAAQNTDLFLKQSTDSPHKSRGLFFMDEPEHSQARSVIEPQFLQAIQTIAQSAHTKAEHTLQTLLTTMRPCSLDIVTQYATPVLQQVFMEMFGWPREQWDSLGQLVEILLDTFCPMLPPDQRLPHYASAMQIMHILSQGTSLQCPAHQSPDAAGSAGLMPRLRQLGIQGELDPTEALTSGLHFLLGGYLSSAFLVGTAVHNLLAHPSALVRYRHGDATLRASAFEELKRFDAPFQLADRYAAQDTTLAGVNIPQNALVSLVYGSANRDKSVFGPTADQLNIERACAGQDNLVFGIGAHHCIGAPMANQVVPVVLQTLLDKLPHASLPRTDLLQWRPDPYFRALQRLPIFL